MRYLPVKRKSEGSYSRRNRQAIAAREDSVAYGYIPSSGAYRMAIEREVSFRPPEPTRVCRSPEHAADKEMELD